MIPLLIEAAQEMDTIFWQQVYPTRDSLLAHGSRLRDPRVHPPQLRPLGPPGRQRALRPRRRAPPRRRGAFYPADMSKEEFEAAAKAAPDGGAALRSLYTVVRRDSSRRTRGRPLPPGLRRRLPPGRGEAPRGGRAGRRPGPQEVPGAPGRRARDRRLPAQRPRLAGHEAERGGRRHRSDRDLRRRALRLQGRARGLRPGQGPGVERAARPVREAAARPAARSAGARGVQAGEARHRLRPQRLRRASTTPARPTPAPRPSRSTCPTTSRSS